MHQESKTLISTLTEVLFFISSTVLITNLKSNKLWRMVRSSRPEMFLVKGVLKACISLHENTHAKV